MSAKTDNLFQQPVSKQPFNFDGRVAAVFEDMISRSVPGYAQILSLLPTLVKQFQHADKNYYDLGCSLGAGMLAMAEGLTATNCKIIGIDNSEAMIRKAKTAIAPYANNCPHPLVLEYGDITETELTSAGMVLMNFTLQFVPLQDRDELIAKIYSALADGGALVLSEKIQFESNKVNNTLTSIHHQFKSDQGYSDLEIAQKRDALENVLIPETLATHRQRLTEAGFSVVTPWLQNLQFVSILAIK